MNYSYPQTHNPSAITPPHLAFSPSSSLLPSVLDDSIEEKHAELSEERLVTLSFPNTDLAQFCGSNQDLYLSGKHLATKLHSQTTVFSDRSINAAQPVFELLRARITAIHHYPWPFNIFFKIFFVFMLMCMFIYFLFMYKCVSIGKCTSQIHRWLQKPEASSDTWNHPMWVLGTEFWVCGRRASGFNI